MHSVRQYIFYATFGILLPILCFVLDPGVMTGEIGFGVIALAPLFVYAVAGLNMLAMTAWLVEGGRSIELDAAIGGVLTIGTVLAAVVGVFLLPFSFIASFFLIGMLGFVPFGTAAACWSARERALEAGTTPRARAIAWVSMAMVVVLAVGYELAGDAAIARATRTFEVSSSPSARREAVEELARLRLVLPDRVIARRSLIAAARSRSTEEFVRTYREVTGVDLFAASTVAD